MTPVGYKDVKCIIGVAVVVTLLLLMYGCSSVRFIPIETVKVEYRTRDSIRYDSIYKHDSIYIKEKGDTVYKYIKQVANRYIFVNKTDTIIKTDSVQVPCPVEKKLTKWESIKLDMGGWMFGALLIILLYIMYKRYIR